MPPSADPEAILLLSARDQLGIVATVANAIHAIGGNILDAAQHTDFQSDTFFQRVHVSWPNGDPEPDCLEQALAPLQPVFKLNWRIRWVSKPKRVAVFVSKEDHCLHDLLLLQRDGSLHCEVPLIVSNHPDLASVAQSFGIPYHHVPVQSGGHAAAEEVQRALLDDYQVDLVVLARYMQILSADFVDAFPSRIINIHHSFVPAFAGAAPYRQAHDKGVKLIGAPAHFATADLDECPIIEQGVTRVSHRDTVSDMMRKGRDTERAVLARAVRWYLEDRIMVHNGRAVVFD